MIDMTGGIWFIDERIDTRNIDLDTRKPIAGTGDFYNCDCCGKEHEVWVYVYSKAGDHGIVGTNCAKKAGAHGRDRLSANYTTTRHNPYLFAQHIARAEKFKND